jgi:hypothetical protein
MEITWLPAMIIEPLARIHVAQRCLAVWATNCMEQKTAATPIGTFLESLFAGNCEGLPAGTDSVVTRSFDGRKIRIGSQVAILQCVQAIALEAMQARSPRVQPFFSRVRDTCSAGGERGLRIVFGRRPKNLSLSSKEVRRHLAQFLA